MSRENFLYWKELVGLENTDFPRLRKLEEEQIPKKAKISVSRTQEIVNALASNEHVDVQVEPGWGATTLFYYMADKLTGDRRTSLKICVKFDFEIIRLEDLTEDEFIFQAKWKLAYNLIQLFLAGSFQEDYMFEVFDYEDDRTKAWKGFLREKKKDAINCENDSEEFYKKFPFFENRTIAECEEYFLTNFQLQTVFMYNFPRNCDEDSVTEFIGFVKSIYEWKSMAPAAHRDLYFLTQDVFQMIHYVYEIRYKDIYYKRYTPAEIYAMMLNLYKTQDIEEYSEKESQKESIINVFEQDFITEVYDENLTLNEIMEKVEELIIESLEVEKSQIPYKLSLRKNG